MAKRFAIRHAAQPGPRPRVPGPRVRACAGAVPVTDRHANPKLSLRVTPQRADTWRAAAAYVGEPLNTFIANAVESRIASWKTARLRLTKSEHATVRAFAKSGHETPCPDIHCSKPEDHAGPCNWGRQP